jgi:hypothetical protein
LGRERFQGGALARKDVAAGHRRHDESFELRGLNIQKSFWFFFFRKRTAYFP